VTFYWNKTAGKFPGHGGKPVLITREQFEECCCAAPDDCPCDQESWDTMACGGATCGGLVACYQIKDYEAGVTLTACEDCDDATGDPEWDGTFRAQCEDQNRCTWINEMEGIGSIDGKAYPWCSITLAGNKWLIAISCFEMPTTTHDIWLGEKTKGTTPVGEYARTGGCDEETETLVIEACP